jgi:hypothetical protein
MEYVTIKITKENFESLIGAQALTGYEVKAVTVKDVLFKDDETHKLLKKDADKAYKKLQEYEFKKRHNIKPSH